MFQYISVFLSHYPPKWLPFPVDSDKQNSHKQVRVLAHSSCFRSVYLRALMLLSSRVCMSSYCLQVQVIYLCITHTVQVVLTGRLSSTGPRHPDIWSCCISISQASCLQSKQTCMLCCRAPGLAWCVSSCVAGERCVLNLVFPAHLSYFKTLYSAVLLLIPLLLLCLRVPCPPIAIH